ncbi:NAD(P)H-dependent oxidoreductase [Paenibacillus sacheonensis]|uniref:FMN dependent NADH:quinone oxidoreductase n=1 Tax=Paenibacillus sacheonensis TaxID=742054 RepID=A0A7X5C1Q5_9BACL|nr:NAD(P)H-dependent oxidoreductase [Paenibacillus sacheonensis]MBM7566341.1 FMN-dependent NADH-azoreductase [Paenibacillus sacheonensis]NBC70545.1 FMN-dependent NADH-azoreductase [Paenibacillus sacheonensis]
MVSFLKKIFGGDKSKAPEKVLYITAHPNNQETSYSMSVGAAFIETYRKVNPNDEVVHLDLYNSDIPEIDADVLNGWKNAGEGKPLSAAEQAKLARLNELVDQFVEADKYVFVNPIWNFSFPPVLKAYIDAVCVAGKTFQYVPGKGPVGLLDRKKAVHIQASGSVLSPGSDFAAFEMGHRHLNVVMKFLGVPSLEGIFVEGMAAASDQAQTIKDKTIHKAREIAKTF